MSSLREKAEKYAAKHGGTFVRTSEAAYLAGYRAAIEAAAKVAERGVIVNHDYHTGKVTAQHTCADEIRKLAEE